MARLAVVAALLCASAGADVSRLCNQECQAIIAELPQGQDCQKFRMTLPRPKARPPRPFIRNEKRARARPRGPRPAPRP